MTRRITCCVAFVTLIWGAHTEDEKIVPDMFKSNMTRNDFSNLLQSLINLNEQRVSVLQKLYRLEDYGVLSEVLRSGDKKTENGNPNNLFLIVMSKGAVDAKNIIQTYQVLRDDGESRLAEDKQPTANDDEILYNLLGLVTFEGNETFTRRNIDLSGNSAGIENESEDDDDIEDIELRAHDKAKKKHHSKDKFKTRQKKSKRKDKKPTKTHTALRDERDTVQKELKAKCISEIDFKVVKCIQACHRTHQDVCSRLACSVRSRRELRKECEISCKEIFVPEAC